MNTENIQELIINAQNDPSLLSTIDVDALLDSIETKNNDYLTNKTISEIHNDKYNAFKNLGIDDENLKLLCEKLTEYRFVDEIYELHKGKHVRYMNISNARQNPKLTTGGIVVDVKFLDNGTQVLCMNNQRRFIQYKYDFYLTFQKLSPEEQLILMIYEEVN